MYSSEEHLGIPRVGPQALSTTSLTFSSVFQTYVMAKINSHK